MSISCKIFPAFNSNHFNISYKIKFKIDHYKQIILKMNEFGYQNKCLIILTIYVKMYSIKRY